MAAELTMTTAEWMVTPAERRPAELGAPIICLWFTGDGARTVVVAPVVGPSDRQHPVCLVRGG